ncbi:hypothetical protein, partial [Mycobacterium tuberculosis]|uniref:hypothetical protein n=1 Tax=Mycobacterium tuberculosis TaxID=1773 RepID=UPI0025518A26
HSAIIAAVASVVTATSSVAAYASDCTVSIPHKDMKKVGSGTKGNDKFAPRFDGLRFIETLVTAHR